MIPSILLRVRMTLILVLPLSRKMYYMFSKYILIFVNHKLLQDLNYKETFNFSHCDYQDWYSER